MQDAIPLLEKLGADYPGERLLQVILGQIYQGQNEPEKARVAFEKAREIGPESARVRAFLANAGYLKLEAGDYKTAIAELTQANPDDPFHQLLLARAYDRSGDKADAQKTYRKVVDSRQNGIERALAYPEAKRKL